ncbi:MAG: hypothetical protein AB7U23_13735 [Dehalococcoidia bacterium]
MRTAVITLAIVALVGAGVAIAGASSSADAPLKDPARADCPGLIECPLTGELICADKCPLNTGDAQDESVPQCCRDKK